jgi:16S rRNA (cytidine1402-2'-O)-methyltransferase
MLSAWGDRRAVVARELTKIHEEFLRGTLSGLLADVERRPRRGEITLLIAGKSEN